MRNEDEVSLLEHDEDNPTQSHLDPRCSHCHITSPEIHFSRHSSVRSLGAAALWVFSIAITFFLAQRFTTPNPPLEDFGTGHSEYLHSCLLVFLTQSISIANRKIRI
jgi:hypothetical protein